MHNKLLLTIIGLVSLLIIGCQSHNQDDTLNSIPLPDLGPNATAEPNLELSPDGQSLYLSWLEETSDTTAKLWVSSLQNNDKSSLNWKAPELLSEGENWFINWADFPSVLASDNGIKAFHWLQKRPGGPYAYDVNIKHRLDSDQWSSAITPHMDGTASEHGFVSLTNLPNSNTLAIWLDGRAMTTPEPPNAMTLRSAEITSDGTVTAPRQVDDWVCDCCQTDAIMFNDNALLAYRNRTSKEIRDIGLAVYRPEAQRWEQLGVLWPDNWEIGGCPVNGPALAAQSEHAAMVWYTQAQDDPQVKIGLLNDNFGVHNNFTEPVRIDLGSPLGRVDVISASLQGKQGYIVTWVEKGKKQQATIMARFIDQQKTVYDPVTIASISAARKSGFPRAALFDDSLVIAYTKVLSDEGKTEIATRAIPLTTILSETSDEKSASL